MYLSLFCRDLPCSISSKISMCHLLPGPEACWTHYLRMTKVTLSDYLTCWPDESLLFGRLLSQILCQPAVYLHIQTHLNQVCLKAALTGGQSELRSWSVSVSLFQVVYNQGGRSPRNSLSYCRIKSEPEHSFYFVLRIPHSDQVFLGDGLDS